MEGMDLPEGFWDGLEQSRADQVLCDRGDQGDVDDLSDSEHQHAPIGHPPAEDGPPAEGDPAAEGDVPGEARVPRIVLSPEAPTMKEVLLHRVTHLPYRSWCPECIRARAVNKPYWHRPAEERAVPTMCLDDVPWK